MRIWTIGTFLGLIILGAVIGICFLKLTDTADETVQEIETRRDHFRMSGEVEFDGERIVYDEIIQVRTDIGTVSTLGLKRGDNRVLVSRKWITRTLRNGGALVMEVPQAGGLFTDLKRTDQPPDPLWTPSYIKSRERPPDEYLPEFLWFDKADNPTEVEAYVAESYYAQSTARLHVIHPIRIEYVPRTPDAEAKAMTQMASERPVKFVDPTGFAWKGMTAFSIPFESLGDLPEENRLEIERLLSEGREIVPASLSEPLWDYARLKLNILPNYRSQGYGVPQPRKYPVGKGVLYSQAIAPTADAVVPVDCDAATKRCVVREGEVGYTIFRRLQFAGSRWEVVLGGRSLEIAVGDAVIDRARKQIVCFGVNQF